MRKCQSYEVMVHQVDAIKSTENLRRIATWYQSVIIDTLQEVNISLEEKLKLLESV